MRRQHTGIDIGNTRSVVVLVAAMILFTGVSGCFDSDDDDDEKPIRIGASLDLTGKYSESSKRYQESYEMWVEELNSGGGLLGREVELVLYDDKSDPATAEGLYERMITGDKVDLVLGGYSSPVINSTASVAEEHHYLFLEAGGMSDEIFQQGYEYTFLGLPGVASEYAKGFIDYLDSLAAGDRPETIALLGEDSSFPITFMEGAGKLAEASGYTIVYNETYPRGTTDLTSHISEIKNRSADVLIAGTYLAESELVVRTCKEIDYDPEAIFTTVGPALAEFGQDLGNDSLYVWSGVHFHPDMPAGKNWSQRFHDKYGREPDYLAAGAYAICQILEQAVESTRSTNNTVLRDYVSETTFQTVVGELKFRSNGQPHYGMLTIQWQMVEDEPSNVVVWPAESATNDPIYPAPAEG